MKSFKTDCESTAIGKNGLKIPPRLMDAHIMDKLKMSYPELLATPSHIIEEILFLWHLQYLQDKQANKS